MTESRPPRFIEPSLTWRAELNLANGGRSFPPPLHDPRQLPVEFRAHLPNSRIARLGDDSKVRGVADVPAGIQKLRVVENVEKFEANVESVVFLDLRSLQDAEVRLIKSGTEEKSPVCGSERSRCHVRREGARQEITSRTRSGDSWVIRRARGIHLPRIALLHGPYTVRHVRSRAAKERKITTALLHLDRESRREPCDSLDLPALRQPLRRVPEKSIEWDSPDVTGHEVVRDICRRQPTAQFRIYEIHIVP